MRYKKDFCKEDSYSAERLIDKEGSTLDGEGFIQKLWNVLIMQKRLKRISQDTASLLDRQ